MAQSYSCERHKAKKERQEKEASTVDEQKKGEKNEWEKEAAWVCGGWGALFLSHGSKIKLVREVNSFGDRYATSAKLMVNTVIIPFARQG